MSELPSDQQPKASEPSAGPPAGQSPRPQDPRSNEEELPPTITIDEFSRIRLKVARVLAAEPHPRADRLLKLRIDLGGEERQLVAGIAAHYRPEDLVGRDIVVVANLQPARLRGELSEGMLLAASAGDVVSLLMPDRSLEPGAEIH